MLQGKRRVVTVAIGVALAGACVGYAGAAGAAEERAADQVIGVLGGADWDKENVSVQTGDSVTWRWAGTGVAHNVRGDTGPAADPNWQKEHAPFDTSGDAKFTFTQPGEYRFVCEAHAATMNGIITVTGDPVEPTPTPTATAPPTQTPAPTARPTVTAPPAPAANNRVTPAPVGSARADTVAPAISKLKLKALRRAAKVSFSLSENAAVIVRLKKGKSTVKTVRLSARSGARSLTVRGLSRGSYRVEIEARDARGNRAAVQRKTVKVKR